ncbi:glycoside hydrolase [Streptomyces platensis subsp. clarensis]|uniref:Glycoside hydrolase n=1 Tax=Streptomyces showdoensis TaxID=68268 RepID=A0A2P2GMN4_STREW|nr:C40 family peptidase [Streptomyces showdoensis]KKZ72764.1 glycoside hydrolase [Streptomyces showdoensis]MCW7991321.1 glycoside hydrolase [Streptomyces platensis subsp. clarensis]
MNRRRHAIATITVVCALTVLASPALTLQAAAAPLPPLPPSQPKKTLEEVRKEIDGLYRQAAAATDAYNLAEEKADEQSDEIVKLARMIVAGNERIDDLKARAGAAARAQYRNGGLPDGAQLVLTNDPQLFLDNASRLKEGQKATRDLLGEMTRTQDELTTYAKDASVNWTKLEANRLKQAKAKKEINDKIAAAKKLESSLAAEERERLLRLEQQEQYRAQTAWLDSGVLKGLSDKATPEGKRAVEFATAQIGKPYVWGAEGPRSYDCSGLTQSAWASAGRPIPRTSQEQWRLLPRVDIKDMRPGDLIVYFKDASHIGMYVGNGAIVHAPRPGRNVTIAGAGSMEILGVVRPG